MDGFTLRQVVTKAAIPSVATNISKVFNVTPVRIQLAGRVVIESDHTVIDERLLYGRQARLIFAMLVVERNRPVHRDELADALWPHGLPRTWGAALRGVVSKVRAFLATAGLSGSLAPSGGSCAYQLHLPEAVVDVEFAYSATEAAERVLLEGNPVRAIALAESARKVVVRPFLPDARGRWVDGVRDRLDKLLLWTLCTLSEGYSQRGRYQHAVHTAEEAIALEPFRERTYQLLMRVHAAAGNPAEALRVYDRCRRLLAKELGVLPAKETAELHLALLGNAAE